MVIIAVTTQLLLVGLVDVFRSSSPSWVTGERCSWHCRKGASGKFNRQQQCCCPHLEGPSSKVLSMNVWLPETQYLGKFSVADLQLGAGVSPAVHFTDLQTAFIWLQILLLPSPACIQPLGMRGFASSYLVLQDSQMLSFQTSIFPFFHKYLLLFFAFACYYVYVFSASLFPFPRFHIKITKCS